MSKQETTPLPGFEDIVPIRIGETDMTDEKHYTGERLYRDHPQVFMAVATSYFVDGLSLRQVAARFKVSPNTVRAIRDMALEAGKTEAARAAFFIKSKADKLKGTIRLRALENLLDRLSDPDDSRKISVDTLMKLADFGIEDDGQRKTLKPTNEPETIDVDEFDDMLNGLDDEKKSAPTSGTTEGHELGVDSPSKCSTQNDLASEKSFALNGGSQQKQGSNGCLCNSLSNSPEVIRNSSDLVQQQSTDSLGLENGGEYEIAAHDTGRGDPGGRSPGEG